jgi:threonine/homoserine/homoserine lactone efflux protein
MPVPARICSSSRGSLPGSPREAGLQTALGLTVGAAIWATVAALGLGILSDLDWLQHGLRLFGGAYLVYFATRIWSGAPLSPDVHCSVADIGWRPFRLGMMTNLANPLSLVFFGGIFAALLPPTLPARLHVFRYTGPSRISPREAVDRPSDGRHPGALRSAADALGPLRD